MYLRESQDVCSVHGGREWNVLKHCLRLFRCFFSLFWFFGVCPFTFFFASSLFKFRLLKTIEQNVNLNNCYCAITMALGRKKAKKSNRNYWFFNIKFLQTKYTLTQPYTSTHRYVYGIRHRSASTDWCKSK